MTPAKPFTSTKEMLTAFGDPKYHTDEAYRKQVEARAAVTLDSAFQDNGEEIDPVVAAKRAADDAAGPTYEGDVSALKPFLGNEELVAALQKPGPNGKPLYYDAFLGETYRAEVDARIALTSAANLGVTTKVNPGALRFEADADATPLTRPTIPAKQQQ